MEELYKKDLHDSDKHDGVIIHLEADILEHEVKWALGSITTNKASGGDGISAELFQILKDEQLNWLNWTEQALYNYLCITQLSFKFMNNIPVLINNSKQFCKSLVKYLCCSPPCYF